MSSNFGAVTRTEILSHIMPNKWSGERLVYVVGTQIFDSTVDEGNGRLNPSRDKKVRRAPQKEGFLLCDSGWCVHILTDRYSLKSTINWMATNKQKQSPKWWRELPHLSLSRKVVLSFLFYISRSLPTADAHTSTSLHEAAHEEPGHNHLPNLRYRCLS